LYLRIAKYRFLATKDPTEKAVRDALIRFMAAVAQAVVTKEALAASSNFLGSRAARGPD
jgi:hypothetical protein